MTYEEFKGVFEAALARGVQRVFPGADCSTYTIEFHGLDLSGDLIDFESAALKLYGNGEEFFFIIDVLIKSFSDGVALAFCRPSGHAPRPWNETWDPSDLGPFRVLGDTPTPLDGS